MIPSALRSNRPTIRRIASEPGYNLSNKTNDTETLLRMPMVETVVYSRKFVAFYWVQIDTDIVIGNSQPC